MEMSDFKDVEGYLNAKGFRKTHRRDYPDAPDARIRVFVHPDARRPRFAFPEVGGKVLKRHFERIKAVVEIHEEFGEEAP